MDVEIHTDLFSIIIILGVVQGFFLSAFFLNKRIRKKPSNKFLGYLMISLALIILEIFLNYTNYITRIIYLDNFSEPLAFALGPLFYIYVYTSYKQKFRKIHFLHLVPFFLYLGYSSFQHIQSAEYHMFSFLDVYHPELNPVRPELQISDDPLLIRSIINELTAVHLFLYLSYGLYYVFRAFRTNGLIFWTKGHKPLSFLRNHENINYSYYQCSPYHQLYILRR